MNTNPPRIDEPVTGDELKIIHIDRRNKRGLVKADNMRFSQPVTLQDWLVDSIMLQDFVKIKKSVVTGELIVVDYFINHEVYDPIHNSYQTTFDTMITDERGVPL